MVIMMIMIITVMNIFIIITIIIIIKREVYQADRCHLTPSCLVSSCR